MTRFTDLVGCELPIQSAPMGWVASTPDLAVAAANVGAHGMVQASPLPEELLLAVLSEVGKETQGQHGVNFIVPFIQDRNVISAVARQAGLVDFHFGDPDAALVERVHAEDALAGWQIGSAAEAKAAAEAGCDLVVAQGVEAGGHVRGTVPRRRLLAEVLDAVDVPVVSTGGIGAAAQVAEALADGADAVRIGTRLIATPEANAHPSYIEALIRASADDTVLTEAFSVMWPDAPHRVLRSSVEAAEALRDEIIGEAEVAGLTMPVPRLSVISPGRTSSGSLEAMALYAGESVDDVREVKPAAEVIAELTSAITGTLKADGRSA